MVLRNKKLFISGLLLGFLFVAFLFGTVALAADIKFEPNVPIPGADNVNTLPEYIKALYKFLVGIAGILAVVMIAVGGLIWLFSGGESGRITKAKEIIFGAVIGLMIALGSYLLLNTINPNLVNLKFKVPSVGKLTLSRTWCKDVELPDDLRDSYWKSKSGESFDAYQRHTLCGQTYEIPGTQGKQTCYGHKVSQSGLICALPWWGRDGQPSSYHPKSFCEYMYDDTAAKYLLSAGQGACNWVKSFVADEGTFGSCTWQENPGVLEVFEGIGAIPTEILIGRDYRGFTDDGCVYRPLFARNYTSGWVFDPGIEAQMSDASPQLVNLINCLRGQFNITQIEENRQIGRISSISDANYKGNLAACANPNSCPNEPACAHSCSPTTSCHYGNADEIPRKSHAVDIGDEENREAIELAIEWCGQYVGYHALEGNHYHISTEDCPRN